MFSYQKVQVWCLNASFSLLKGSMFFVIHMKWTKFSFWHLIKCLNIHEIAISNYILAPHMLEKHWMKCSVEIWILRWCYYLASFTVLVLSYQGALYISSERIILVYTFLYLGQKKCYIISFFMVWPYLSMGLVMTFKTWPIKSCWSRPTVPQMQHKIPAK